MNASEKYAHVPSAGSGIRLAFGLKEINCVSDAARHDHRCEQYKASANSVEIETRCEDQKWYITQQYRLDHPKDDKDLRATKNRRDHSDYSQAWAQQAEVNQKHRNSSYEK
jgi:hypothetical protein